ncbi:MAG: LysR family transcriptional regulator [Microbacterium sp.]|uniref:LysR family transcriptional regulator n=1 Tax=Microbacterium sp. TaxID=51671 RepID=UPI003F9E2E66
MLDLHRLVVLREVKLRGSMTAAARELSYSHSAISQQLALLEKETGVTLLEKVGRGVKLTAAGEELVRNTDAILAAVERAETDLASAHSVPHGVVPLAAFATISRTIMPRALSALAEDYPELDVRLQLYDPEAAMIRLVSRQVDAVITDSYPGTEPPTTEGVTQTVLSEDPVRGYLPTWAEDATLETLRTMKWVMEPRGSAAARWAVRVCRERGFEPIIAHESSDLLFHLRMVEQGLAAAFLPDMVVREAGLTVQPSPALPMDQRRSVVFLVRAGAESRPALIAVRDAVAQALHPLTHP